MIGDKIEMLGQIDDAISVCRGLFARAILSDNKVIALQAGKRWYENEMVKRELLMAENPKGKS